MDRTATYTIEEFNYQFNKSILEILKADSNTNIMLEGYIEDIDVFTKDGITAIQCKYYDANEKIKAKDIANHFKINLDTDNNWIKKWIGKEFLIRFDNKQIRNVDYILTDKYSENVK